MSYTRNRTHVDAVDIKKSESVVTSARGPSANGIDHDHDLIYLWLNPVVNLEVTPNSAEWLFGNTGPLDIQYVYVGWLKNPSMMPPGVVDRLQAYGITPEDYPEILKADPFADGSTAIDPARFQMLNMTFPYEPPYAPGEAPPSYQYTLTNATTNSSSYEFEWEFSTSVSFEGSFGFLNWASFAMKNQTSWTWNNKKTRSASTGTSETAKVTVGGPSYGYTGPTDIAVYYDVLFDTFLFAPVEGPLYMRGSVVSQSGKNVAGQEVVVVANGVRHRTYTNSRGEYRFPALEGPIQVLYQGKKKGRSVVGSADRFDLLVP